jgi:hypothetical protein
MVGIMPTLSATTVQKLREAERPLSPTDITRAHTAEPL